MKSINKIKTATQINQWKNSEDVIKWFNGIPNKNICSFTQFDIVEFYPSISKSLLEKALDYAKEFIPINQDDINIIMHARNSILFNGDCPWMKKDGDNLFDVTMGSFDGAEICELVGSYILKMMGDKYGNSNIGLYRDDGLAAFEHANGPQSDRTRKDIIKAFEEIGLKITIQTNLKVVNFLDITFNLNNGSYKPYKKPNDQPMYINKNSNHPPNIIKKLPDSIGRRISNISSNRKIFEDSAQYYNDALKNSGHNDKIIYTEKEGRNNRRNRSRNIIWYNPPFSQNVKSNIAKTFLQLVDKHFPKNHKLSKIFNRNNVKISYSCLPNISTIIKSHNRNLLYNNRTEEPDCNCREKQSCPLNGNCLTRSLIYSAKIGSGENESTYIGLTENSFKDRLYKHRNSFKYRNKVNSTELSKYHWEMKDRGISDLAIEWSIKDHAIPYQNGAKRCDLCLTEKFHILTHHRRILNKRNELISKCRHVNKYQLSNFKRRPPNG